MQFEQKNNKHEIAKSLFFSRLYDSFPLLFYGNERPERCLKVLPDVLTREPSWNAMLKKDIVFPSSLSILSSTSSNGWLEANCFVAGGLDDIAAFGLFFQLKVPLDRW